MFGSQLDTTKKDSVLQLNIVVLLDFVQLGVLFGFFNGNRAALRDGQRAANGPSKTASQQTACCVGFGVALAPAAERP